jgi:hypothetical protein
VLNELSNVEEDIMTHRTKTDALNPELANDKVERIYHDWDAALSSLEELPPEKLEEGMDGLRFTVLSKATSVCSIVNLNQNLYIR